MLATASGKGYRRNSSKVEVRKVSNGKIITSFDFKSANSIVFSSDSNLIAAVNNDGDVNIWQIGLPYTITKQIRSTDEEL